MASEAKLTLRAVAVLADALEVWVDREALVDDEEALAQLRSALGAPDGVVHHRYDGRRTFAAGTEDNSLQGFAERIRHTLVASGLPVFLPAGALARTPGGARIELAPDDGPGGSVSVSWQIHPHVRYEPAAGTALLAQQAMADAMARILTAAGFTTVARSGRLLLRQASGAD